jgi:AcrR family transcriptional regulator
MRTVERLSSNDWLDCALHELARSGHGALKADLLARKIGVSRGSFYWHFSDLAQFHARVIERWRERSTEDVIRELEKLSEPDERLERLLRRAFGRAGLLETRMRSWAESNQAAAGAVTEIDDRRTHYIERLLSRAGVEPSMAATRARILYWTYLGAASSPKRLPKDSFEQLVDELCRFGLNTIFPSDTVRAASGSRGITRARG